MLFGMDGKQVPKQTVVEVGDAFKKILDEVVEFLMCFSFHYFQLCASYMQYENWCFMFWVMQTEKVRNEYSQDMSIRQAISIILDRHPELKYGKEKNLLQLVLFTFYT